MDNCLNYTLPLSLLEGTSSLAAGHVRRRKRKESSSHELSVPKAKKRRVTNGMSV